MPEHTRVLPAVSSLPHAPMVSGHPCSTLLWVQVENIIEDEGSVIVGPATNAMSQITRWSSARSMRAPLSGFSSQSAAKRLRQSQSSRTSRQGQIYFLQALCPCCIKPRCFRLCCAKANLGVQAVRLSHASSSLSFTNGFMQDSHWTPCLVKSPTSYSLLASYDVQCVGWMVGCFKCL